MIVRLLQNQVAASRQQTVSQTPTVGFLLLVSCTAETGLQLHLCPPSQHACTAHRPQPAVALTATLADKAHAHSMYKPVHVTPELQPTCKASCLPLQSPVRACTQQHQGKPPAPLAQVHTGTTRRYQQPH